MTAAIDADRARHRLAYVRSQIALADGFASVNDFGSALEIIVRLPPNLRKMASLLRRLAEDGHG